MNKKPLFATEEGKLHVCVMRLSASHSWVWASNFASLSLHVLTWKTGSQREPLPQRAAETLHVTMCGKHPAECSVCHKHLVNDDTPPTTN